MNENNISDNGLDDLYHAYWEVHNQKIGEYSPLEVAAILMTQSLTIYKTVLSEEDYNKMVDDISRMRGQVKEIPNPESYLH